MIYNIYKILTIILSPFISAYLHFRLIKKKEDKESEAFSCDRRKNPRLSACV